MSPHDSDDLTEVVESRGENFTVLRSADDAEYEPNYSVVAFFATRKEAETFIANLK